MHRGRKKNILGVKNVYVISKTKLSDNALWVPEDKLPFSLEDVAGKIGKHWRTAWYYADLLEGCASILIDGPSPYTLILDADTVFLRPVSLIEDGVVLLNSSPTDGTPVYYEYIRRLIPGLSPQNGNSGITHWILQEKSIVQEMVKEVERIHGKTFWEAAIDITCQEYQTLHGNNDHEKCPGKMANFELYFTYALKHHSERVRVHNQKSILAYKESLGLEGYRKSELSRTNIQGKRKIMNLEDREEINTTDFVSLEDSMSFICKRCAEKEWDTITFQMHFWLSDTEYRNLKFCIYSWESMKLFELESLSTVSPAKLKKHKQKASNGYQMLRFPRAGSTAAIHTFYKAFGLPDPPPPKEKFLMLGCSSFSKLPFSWGPRHHKTLYFPGDITVDHPSFDAIMADKIDASGATGLVNTFNTRTDKKIGFDSNKLIFQIVRNPFDWLISVYEWNFMGVRSGCGVPHLWNANRSSGFEQFIRKYFDIKLPCTWEKKIIQPFPWPMMDRCFFQSFDSNNHCNVDVFIRFEFLQEGLDKLFELGDLPKEMIPKDEKKIQPKITNTQSVPYNDRKKKYYISRELVSLVERAYKWDLETFNYGYDGVRDSISVLVPRNG